MASFYLKFSSWQRGYQNSGLMKIISGRLGLPLCTIFFIYCCACHYLIRFFYSHISPRDMTLSCNIFCPENYLHFMVKLYIGLQDTLKYSCLAFSRFNQTRYKCKVRQSILIYMYTSCIKLHALICRMKQWMEA